MLSSTLLSFRSCFDGSHWHAPSPCQVCLFQYLYFLPLIPYDSSLPVSSVCSFLLGICSCVHKSFCDTSVFRHFYLTGIWKVSFATVVQGLARRGDAPAGRKAISLYERMRWDLDLMPDEVIDRSIVAYQLTRSESSCSQSWGRCLYPG